MALNSKSSKKRKSDTDVIFEIDDGDCSSPSSPDSATKQTETSTETNSNLTIETFPIIEKPSNNCQKLKLEEPKNNGKCILDNTSLTTDTIVEHSTSSNRKNYLFTIKFADENFARIHKKRLIKAVMGIFDYEICHEVNHSSFEVKFWEEKPSSDMDIVDDSDSDRESQINLENYFVVDTTPNAKPKLESTPRYVHTQKFGAMDEKDKEATAKISENKPVMNNCFNCNGNHNLKDCPVPKDHRRIQSARNTFKTKNSKNTRYHLDEEQKFGHLAPGKISNKLRDALNLNENEIPVHVYHMRRLGYPPGWLEMAKITSSNLTIFDFHGSSMLNSDFQEVLDPLKIIEYPGFNVLEKELKDDYKRYGCPAFSKEHSKEAMVAFIEKMLNNSFNSNNCNTTKPKSDLSSAERELHLEDCEMTENFNEKKTRETSPTLNELEMKKKQLLDMLETSEPGTPVNESINSETNGSEIKNVVKSSIFGTPILKTESSYEKLPCSENFSKDISQVINFENLPNSTGKYEQMTQVINKVRKTIKYPNESN